MNHPTQQKIFEKYWVGTRHGDQDETKYTCHVEQMLQNKHNGRNNYMLIKASREKKKSIYWQVSKQLHLVLNTRICKTLPCKSSHRGDAGTTYANNSHTDISSLLTDSVQHSWVSEFMNENIHLFINNFQVHHLLPVSVSEGEWWTSPYHSILPN